ncbi:MAG TPA: hypothetical protein VK815_03340 [Candidatus Acidoferrales bacterium]|nr:hypothetical protein [Candidatus Acidoferrales bacterium]
MARHKQTLTPYQKQIRFLTCFFGVLMVLTATGLIWLFNTLGVVGRAH